MPNRWIEWVKNWAKANEVTYPCAMGSTECRDQYRKKYGNPKRLTQKTERELMGAEDINAEIVYFTPVKRKRAKKVKPIVENEGEKRRQRLRESKERYKMSDEDFLSVGLNQAEKLKELKKIKNSNVRQKALEIEAKMKQGQKQKQLSASRIMGEPYRPLPRPSLRVEEIEEEIPFPREARKKSKKKVKPIFVIEEEAPKKQRGRPRKYSTKEEAYKAKIEQNRGYKQDQSVRVNELLKKMKEQAPAPAEEIFEIQIPIRKKKKGKKQE